MATVHIALGNARTHGAPVMAKAPREAASLATSGTSAQSSVTAQVGEYAVITSFNCNGFVTIANGSATATAATGYGIASGQMLSVGPLAAGDKIAVIDATVA